MIGPFDHFDHIVQIEISAAMSLPHVHQIVEHSSKAKYARFGGRKRLFQISLGTNEIVQAEVKKRPAHISSDGHAGTRRARHKRPNLLQRQNKRLIGRVKHICHSFVIHLHGAHVRVSIGAGQSVNSHLNSAGASRHYRYVNTSGLARLYDHQDMVLAGAQSRPKTRHQTVPFHIHKTIVVRRLQYDQALDPTRLKIEHVHTHPHLLAQSALGRHLHLHIKLSRSGYTTGHFEHAKAAETRHGKRAHHIISNVLGHLGPELDASVRQRERVLPQPAETVDALDLGLEAFVQRPKVRPVLCAPGLVRAVALALAHPVAPLLRRIARRTVHARHQTRLVASETRFGQTVEQRHVAKHH
ncbi:hypothetical protein BpHYR1_001832 [Brachionus plicatilis]|uniref:Uncharacterized protein n=1 Tax=Brachionus plicatilis TaxID=10195 RepID=A0A3M7SCP4_BRAPC|nr:hypothetical protein BpHYR1_001832 [Brachionus plicatilis]